MWKANPVIFLLIGICALAMVACSDDSQEPDPTNQQCEEGTLGCACGPDDSCEGSLICEADVCVDAAIDAGIDAAGDDAGLDADDVSPGDDTSHAGDDTGDADVEEPCPDTVCGEECVDLETDEEHCGECDRFCPGDCDDGGCITPSWVQGFGDARPHSNGRIAVSSDGTVTIYGLLRGTIDFGGGPLTSEGESDVVVAQFDIFGEHRWSRRFGNQERQVPHRVATNDDGEVVISGVIRGDVDFGGDAPLEANGAGLFVTKLDSDGDYLWSQAFPLTGFFITGVELSEDGSVFMVGSMSQAIDFGGGDLTGEPDSSSDIVVVKFDSDGEHVWSDRFGDSEGQYSSEITLAENGDILLAGEFNGTLDLGGEPRVSTGETDVFVARFDSEGDHIWSRSFESSARQTAYGLDLDSEDRVILGGRMSGSVDFGGGTLVSAGASDIFLAQFSASGDHIWSDRFGNEQETRMGGLATTTDDSIVVAGSFVDDLEWDGETISGHSERNVLVFELDSAGDHSWSTYASNTQYQASTGIGVDGDGNSYIIGSFSGTLDFGVDSIASTGTANDWDYFLLKLSSAEF